MLCFKQFSFTSETQNSHLLRALSSVISVILFLGAITMSYSLATLHRRILFVLSTIAVIIIVLLLSLSLLFSSGMLRLGSAGGVDPNGATNGSMINLDGLASGCTTDPNGGCFHAAHIAWGHGPYPGHGSDPDGSMNQLAMGPVIEPNG
jgi:hypothetical protein